MDRCHSCDRLAEVVLPSLQMLERRVAALEGGRPSRRSQPCRSLQDLLEQRGLSEAALARAIGRHAATVHRWLIGRHRIPIDAAQAIARVLEVPVEVLWAEPSSSRRSS